MLAAGCDEQGLIQADGELSGRSEESVQAGLLQTVTVRSSALLDRRDIEVRSVLQNTGTVPLDLSSRICGLDYAGTLGVTDIPGFMRCLAYGGSRTLAVGDSAVVSDLVRVVSPAGSYVLQVRHALDPEHWASVAVTVRD